MDEGIKSDEFLDVDIFKGEDGDVAIYSSDSQNSKVKKRKRSVNKKYFIEIVKFMREYFSEYVMEEEPFIYMFKLMDYNMRYINGKIYLNLSFVRRCKNLLGLHVYLRRYRDKRNDKIYYRLIFEEKRIKVKTMEMDVSFMEKVVKNDFK